MKIKTNNNILALSIFVFALFISLGTYLSNTSVLWGDEEYHTNTAYSLNHFNQPAILDKMAHEPGVGASETLYTRGLILSKMTAISFKLFNEDIFYPRMIILLTSVLTCLIALFYFYYRLNFSLQAIALTCSMIMGHAFYFESSYFLRFYIFLNLFTLLAIICLWEAHLAFAAKNKRWAIWLLFTLLLVLIPSWDGWQKIHVPILAVAVILFFIGQKESLSRALHAKKKWLNLIVIVSILIAPYMVITLDRLFIKIGMTMGNRAYQGYHHYFWDNALGLTRYFFSLNVLLWVFLKQFKIKPDYTLSEILFFTGIITGFFIGLYVPHNHIFYTRFFLLSTFMATLGAGHVIWKNYQAEALKLSIIYIICNVFLIIAMATYDRPGVTSVSRWLEKNYRPEEQILFTDFDYVWTTRKTFPGTLFFSTGSGEKDIESLVTSLMNSSRNEVLFFYYDHYDFRNNVHQFFFNDKRVYPNTISRSLIQGNEGERVITAHGSGLIRYKKEEIIKLIRNFKPQYGPERFNIIVRTKRFLRSLVGKE